MLFIGALFPATVFAQDTALPTPVQENPKTELPSAEVEINTNTNQQMSINEDTQTTFRNGIIAGALVGLVLGGVLTWFLKDKII